MVYEVNVVYLVYKGGCHKIYNFGVGVGEAVSQYMQFSRVTREAIMTGLLPLHLSAGRRSLRVGAVSGCMARGA